jgi:HPt (histidine-containing phosphotransfer) domain-containing protein
VAEDDLRQTKAYAAFREECSNLAVLYSAAVDGWDLERAIVDFHRLKGASGFFAHEKIRQLAGNIEKAIKQRKFAEIGEDVSMLLFLLRNLDND